MLVNAKGKLLKSEVTWLKQLGELKKFRRKFNGNYPKQQGPYNGLYGCRLWRQRNARAVYPAVYPGTAVRLSDRRPHRKTRRALRSIPEQAGSVNV